MINVNYLLKYDCTVCGGGNRADGRGRCSPCVSVCPCVRSICTVFASLLVLRFRPSGSASGFRPQRGVAWRRFLLIVFLFFFWFFFLFRSVLTAAAHRCRRLTSLVLHLAVLLVALLPCSLHISSVTMSQFTSLS